WGLAPVSLEDSMRGWLFFSARFISARRPLAQAVILRVVMRGACPRETECAPQRARGGGPAGATVPGGFCAPGAPPPGGAIGAGLDGLAATRAGADAPPA